MGDASKLVGTRLVEDKDTLTDTAFWLMLADLVHGIDALQLTKRLGRIVLALVDERVEALVEARLDALEPSGYDDGYAVGYDAGKAVGYGEGVEDARQGRGSSSR